MAVPFTQYLRPDGHRRDVQIDLHPAVEAKARRILEAGYKFECEELRTGECSFTISDPVKQRDVAIKVCPNGPDVPATVIDLILGFRLRVPIREHA